MLAVPVRCVHVLVWMWREAINILIKIIFYSISSPISAKLVGRGADGELLKVRKTIWLSYLCLSCYRLVQEYMCMCIIPLLCLCARMRTAAYGSLFVCVCVRLSVCVLLL